MSDPSKTEQLTSIQQRLQSLVAALSNATMPASPAEPPDRAPKPIALTFRLDQARYERLNAYAARFTPRKSFQTIVTELLDQFLDEKGWGVVTALDTNEWPVSTEPPARATT